MMRILSTGWALLSRGFLACMILFISQAEAIKPPFRLSEDENLRWYKGNTHTHTLWSDGEIAPEMAVGWYKDHGYDFLCLSDHNVLSDGSKEEWRPIKEDERLTPARVKDIEERFGEGWVVIGENEGQEYMKLKTLPEIKECFEKPGEFILIQAEEITCFFPKVHMNALNLQRVIPPVNDMTHSEAMLAILRNVGLQSDELGMPTLVYLNHPNWSEGITSEDILGADRLRFFEVYNGHPGVRNWGSDELHMPPTDRHWDIVLSMRIKQGIEEPLYGVGTDDTHVYYTIQVGESNPGRGWVRVLAEELTADSLIAAMKKGRFYASSGVEIKGIEADDEAIRIQIQDEPGVTYTTQFIGTRKGFDPSSKPVLDDEGNKKDRATDIYSDDIGQVLSETTENPAVYAMGGDELYVRAKIVSSQLQENPHQEGDFESAWTQPVYLE